MKSKAPGYYPKYSGKSGNLNNALKELGEWPLNAKGLKKVAAANDIADYTGRAEQNLALIELLKSGVLIKPKISIFDTSSRGASK